MTSCCNFIYHIHVDNSQICIFKSCVLVFRFLYPAIYLSSVLGDRHHKFNTCTNSVSFSPQRNLFSSVPVSLMIPLLSWFCHKSGGHLYSPLIPMCSLLMSRIRSTPKYVPVLSTDFHLHCWPVLPTLLSFLSYSCNNLLTGLPAFTFAFI